MTPKQMIIELIACKEFEVIEEREMRPLFTNDYEEYNKEYTISLHLTEFTQKEIQDITKIEKIEFEGDYYYFQNLNKN